MIKNLGQEDGLWFQTNLEASPPILIISNPKTQKQKFIFGVLDDGTSKYNLGTRCTFSFKRAEAIIEIVFGYRSVYWYKNKIYHRLNGPARIFSTGAKEWFKNGERHREDGPALVYADGSKYWYKHGKQHREDGPAVVHSNGRKEWYKNGKFIAERL